MCVCVYLCLSISVVQKYTLRAAEPPATHIYTHIHAHLFNVVCASVCVCCVCVCACVSSHTVRGTMMRQCRPITIRERLMTPRSTIYSSTRLLRYIYYVHTYTHSVVVVSFNSGRSTIVHTSIVITPSYQQYRQAQTAYYEVLLRSNSVITP